MSVPAPVRGPAREAEVLSKGHGLLQILVVGGTFDHAAPFTLASQASYLLDVTRTGGLTWQPEATATPRVMPDAVLLPDGTVLVVNGANYGTAGKLPQAMHSGPYVRQRPRECRLPASGLLLLGAQACIGCLSWQRPLHDNASSG